MVFFIEFYWLVRKFDWRVSTVCNRCTAHRTCPRLATGRRWTRLLRNFAKPLGPDTSPVPTSRQIRWASDGSVIIISSHFSVWRYFEVWTPDGYMRHVQTTNTSTTTHTLLLFISLPSRSSKRGRAREGRNGRRGVINWGDEGTCRVSARRGTRTSWVHFLTW